jgi:hypothetical protein
MPLSGDCSQCTSVQAETNGRTQICCPVTIRRTNLKRPLPASRNSSLKAVRKGMLNLQVVEAHRVMRRRGSHILQTIGSQIVVRLSALRVSRPLPPARFLVLIPLIGWVEPRAIVRLEKLVNWKNPITSSGINHVTFRLVAQCLNQLRYGVPPQITHQNKIKTGPDCVQPGRYLITAWCVVQWTISTDMRKRYPTSCVDKVPGNYWRQSNKQPVCWTHMYKELDFGLREMRGNR